jgi:hypothetical protein
MGSLAPNKPMPGARIDGGNLYARSLVGCWLFNEPFGVVANNLAAPASPAKFVNSVGRANNNALFGVLSASSEGTATNYQAINSLTRFSVLVRFVLYGAAQKGNARIIEKGANNEWGICFDATGAKVVVQNAATIIATSATVTPRTALDAGFSRNPSGTIAYLNGNSFGTSATAVTCSTADLHFGQFDNSVGGFNFVGEIAHVFIFNTDLPPAAWPSLMANPYQVIARPSLRYVSYPSFGQLMLAGVGS